jgi:hypothetical protein
MPEKYTVFFSHKANDESITNAIINVIDTHTENIKFFISENIEKGTDWREKIAECLTSAGFLVLVFTDPKEDWGWCLYETGFFDALRQVPGASETKRIFCLHNPLTKPPSQISHLQSVPATVTDVRQWLEGLYRLTEQSKPQFIKDVPNTAARICELFSSEKGMVYSAKSISVTVSCKSISSPDDLPDDTVIKGENRVIEELFGANDGRLIWKDVRERLIGYSNTRAANLRTFKEVSRAVYCICKNNRVLPIQGVIFVGNGPKRYRPIVSRAREQYDGAINCEVLLVEDVGGPLQNVDKKIGALLTAIRVAVRIRWEVVRPFSSKIRLLASDDAKKLRFDLQTCFNNIFSEAEFRGSYSLSDVWEAFEDRLVQSGEQACSDRAAFLKINENFKDLYPKIWRSIGFADEKETFGEVSSQPFSEDDLKLLESELEKLRIINSDFLDMAVGRAAVLIREELGLVDARHGASGALIQPPSAPQRACASAPASVAHTAVAAQQSLDAAATASHHP